MLTAVSVQPVAVPAHDQQVDLVVPGQPDQLGRDAVPVAQRIEGVHPRRPELVGDLLELPALLAREDGIARLNERMQVMVASMAGVRTFVMVNAKGIAVASNRKELIGIDFHEGERYRVIRARPDPSKLYVSPPYMTPLGNWALSLGRAIVDRQGAFDGYILAIIDPAYFNLLLDSLRYAPDMSSTAIHGGGVVGLLIDGLTTQPAIVLGVVARWRWKALERSVVELEVDEARRRVGELERHHRGAARPLAGRRRSDVRRTSRGFLQ